VQFGTLEGKTFTLKQKQIKSIEEFQTKPKLMCSGCKPNYEEILNAHYLSKQKTEIL